MKNEPIWTMVGLLAMWWFIVQILYSTFPAPTTERECFGKRETCVAIRTCLAEKRSASECLAEARAVCLANLASAP